MKWNAWKRWIRRRPDDDFAAEIDAHIAMEVERLIESGMSEDDARFAARRTFGNQTSAREHFHDSRPGSGIEWVAQDVRYALRTMRHSPGFTAIAVTSLAIGIGANTTMFGAVDTLLIRAPAHVNDATRIHRVYFEYPRSDGTVVAMASQSYRTYTAIRDRVQGFEAVGAFWSTTVSSGRGTDARPFDAVLVTPSMFTMLGVRPALGRFFVPSEERDENDHVAVLGFEAWRAGFAGDSSVLGRAIDVAGTPYIVVGVAPEGFTGINLNRVDLWLPIGAANKLLNPRAVGPDAGGFWLEIAAKRRAAVPAAQTEKEVTNVHSDQWRDSPRYRDRMKARAMLGPVVAARGPAANDDAKVSVWVAVVSLLVLLIASANVANLLLLRGLTRSREVALRLSLGATRWRLVRQWLVEGALLAAAGALCAIVLARWSASAMQAFLLPQGVSRGLLEPRLLAFTAVVALGSGVLASLVPAFVTARRDFGPLLGSGRGAGGGNRLALQRTLIGGQVALATLLLVGAGLFVTSLRNIRAIDLGLDVDHILYVKVNLGPSGQKAGDPGATTDAKATYTAMLESVRRLPGVANATLTAGEPLTSGWGMSLTRRGAPPQAPGAPPPIARAVGSNYFETMGTTLRRGRVFTAADHRPDANVAIVDEATAKHFWPDGNPLDPCVYLDSQPTCTQIVGVVANTVLWEITGETRLIVYVPLEAAPAHSVSMMEVRTTGDPAAMIGAVRQAIASVSPYSPWADIQPLSRRLAPQLRPWRLGASMFTAFGVLALCLAAVGLYGLLSYMVAQRSHEIGVRKALGASDGGIVRMVLGGAIATTVSGVAIGIVIALLAGRLVASQLYGVSARDPAVIALCAGTLVVVAILACLPPMRRATSVDPMVALRVD